MLINIIHIFHIDFFFWLWLVTILKVLQSGNNETNKETIEVDTKYKRGIDKYRKRKKSRKFLYCMESHKSYTNKKFKAMGLT